MLPSGRSPLLRIVCTILVLFCGAVAAQAQQCEAPPQISAPPQVCPWTPAPASLLPPAEGTWATASWGITNGSFVDENGNTIPYANGENILFQADGNGPVTLSVYAYHSSGCSGPQGTAEVPIRTIPPPQLSVPPQVCPWTPAPASVLPPAEGSWATVSWSITNGSFVDANGNTIPYANGENILFQGDGNGPVILSASAEDSFGCHTLQGSAEVPIRTIPPPQLSVPPQVCPWTPAPASILPPAEGTWQTVSWGITNGSFVDANGNTIQYANGETILFQANGDGPVTLYASAEDSFGCHTLQGSAEVPIRTIPPPQLSVPPQVCPYTTATASILPPAEGTWAVASWSITNGWFVDANGNTIQYANGETIHFRADGNGPVTLYASAGDSFGCHTLQGSAEVPIRTIPPPQLSVPPEVCPYKTATASILPPAEGTWAIASWSITNGWFVDANGNTIQYANGETILFQADGQGPVTLYASAGDSFGCHTLQGSAEVPIRTIPPPQISAPPELCPYTTATASILPPAEGTWAIASWSITNGTFVDANGNTIQYANGETILFQATGEGPVTLYVSAGDSFGCHTLQGTTEVPLRTISAPQITAPTQVCTSTPATASILPPAEGTWQYVSWSIIGGTFLDGQGNPVMYGNGATVQFVATGSDPVELFASAQDSFGCSAMQGTVTIPTVPGGGAVPSITLSSPDVCGTEPITASVDNTFSSYAWDVGNATITSGTGTHEITFVADGDGPVTVSIETNSASCPGTDSETLLLSGGPASFEAPASACAGSLQKAWAPYWFNNFSWTATNATIEGPADADAVLFRSTGTGPVVLTLRALNNDSCFTSHSVTIPLDGYPAPAIYTPQGDWICPDGSLGVQAQDVYPSYTWSVTNATITGGQGTPFVNFTHDGSGDIAVTLNVGEGACSASNTKVIVVRSTVNIIAELASPNVCPNGTGTFYVDNYDSFSYVSVSVPNGTLLSTSAGRVPGGRTYTFRNNGAADTQILIQADSNSCLKQAELLATMLPEATATITPSGPTTFCESGSVILTANISASYLWSNGATTRSITVSASGSHSVTVTNVNGCSKTSAPVTVTVISPPATPVVTASGPTTFCEGGSVTLTAPAATSYHWSNGATTQSIVVSESGTYLATVMNANGCAAQSVPTIVTVNANPATPIVTASGPTTFCAGGSVTLTAPAAASYLWSNGATTQSIAVSASGSHSVTVTNASGCSATSAPTSVTVNPVPATPVITPGGPTTFCEGGSVTLTAPAAASYLWSNGATTQSITVNASGSYSVTVANASGCAATSAATSVTVNASPATPVITPSGPTTFCEGGSVTLTAPAAASYLWSNGETSQSIVVSASGPYSVTVTNASGCSATSAVTNVVANAVPETPVVTANGPTTFCQGGSVTLTAPASASYAWSNGATTQSITVNAAGSYSVTITNGAGCSATSAATAVTVNANPVATVTAGGSTTFCEGGSVTLTASAGSSYLWSNGATTQSIDVTASGSYSVTVTNASNCSATSAATNVIVNALPPATITPSGPTTFCDGGSVTLTAPLSSSYLWSTGATTRQIGVIASGTFTVTVTNANGCTATSAPVTVTENVPVKPTITPSATNVCPGTSVTLTSSEAVSYRWSTGATTRSITFTPSSSTGYWVFATDANGCEIRSDVITVFVDAASKPNVTIYGNPAPYCDGEILTLGATDYFPPRTYLWSTGETTRTIQATAPGTYTVTTTNPTGCSSTSDPVVLTAETPTATVSGTDAVCPGQPATIQADLTGTAPWNITWSDGVTQTGITTSPATRVVTPSATTTYTLTAFTDANCTGTRSGFAIVTVNSASASITAGGPTTFCEGGSVTLTASAGESYLWSNGATTQSIAVGASGSYSVTVTNANGCSATSAGTNVTVSANPVATIAPGGPTTFCQGGSVTLTASAGSSYLWSNGATTQSIVVSASGSSSVTVTNANGCSATSAATSVTVNANPAATITAGGPTTFCAGGSVTLTASAGSSYLWSTGATTQSIAVSASGSYSVTVSNASGCSATSAATSVTVNANPATPAITAGGPTTFCEGGSVTLTAPASTSYLWSTGATTQSIAVSASGSYSVTVTNASGCSATSAATNVTVNAAPAPPVVTPSGPTTFCEGGSVTLTAPAAASYLWSNGATTQSIDATASGSYTVTVTNANGCSATSAAMPVTVNANPAATITAGGPTTFCEGGSVTLTASAGSSYLWSNGATTQSIAVGTSGSYSVTVTSAAGCSATSAATAVTVNANPVATITPGGPTTFCQGGSVTLTASAGSSYLWSTGATTQSIAVSASGSYSVTVTNAAGCSTTSAATAVTVNANPVATITPSGPTTFCQGGSVTLTASAGSSYLWSTGATTQAIAVNASGSYSVTVTNANGCSTTSAPTGVTVNANPATPAITPSGPTTFCAGGSVTLTAPASASYLWSNGATTQSIAVNASGSYSVTVGNASGCSATSAATAVTVNPLPAVPVITPSGSTALCPGASVTLTAPASASYLWSTGATTQSIVVSAAGSYSVTVTNASGCSRTSAAVSVTANPPTVITTHPLTQTMPRNVTRVLSVAATGTATLQYQWYQGASGNTSTPLAGQTASTMTIGAYSKKGTHQFWVRVTSTGCPGSSANSNTATITVN